MRNLKRALSMLLSSTMVLGMVVMGGSAAGYQDVDDTYNKEAIEVLQAAGIMTGDENGNFAPETTVTRNQMAVIMANLMAYNVATYAGTSPFTDVPEWAEPYVAACWTNGITAGIGENLYGGDQEVTTAQAALMIMKALGYFQYQVDFGDDWQLATVKQANKIDLFDDVDSGVKEAMSRNDVAQLVLNGLEAGMVEPDDNTIIVDNGDTTVTVGSVNYEYVTSGLAYATAINAGLTVGSGASGSTGDVGNGSIVQLGEKLYQGDLKKAGGADAFGRPATVWSYKNNEIGTYVDAVTQTWTGKVTEKDLYNAAGTSAVNGYTWSFYRNGDWFDGTADGDSGYDLDRNSTDRWGNTGNGVLTEMFVDTLNESVVVSVIDTFVGEVTKIEENDDDYTVTVSYKNGGTTTFDREINTEDSFEKGDIVVLTVSDVNGTTNLETIQKAEIVTGTVTAVKDNDYVKLDGETYNYNYLYTLAAAAGNPTGYGDGLLQLDNSNEPGNPDVGNNLTLYLDATGNAVAMENASITAEDFLYLKAGESTYGALSAKVVFYDGREEIIDIHEIDGDGEGDALYTKEELDKNDVYRFVKVGEEYDLFTDKYDVKPPFTADIENGIALVGGEKVDSKTVFVDTHNNKSYVGYKEVPSMADADVVVVYKEKSNGTLENVASVVYITNDVQYEIDNDNFVFLTDVSYEVENTDDYDKLYHYTGYINGEKTTVTATTNAYLDTKGMWKIEKVDSNGYVTSATLIAGLGTDIDFTNLSAYATQAKDGVLVVSDNGEKVEKYTGNTFTYNEDTLFVTANMKKNSATVISDVNVGSVGDIETFNGDYTDPGEVTAVFVLNVEDVTDATPLAKLVLVVVPNQEVTPAPEAPKEPIEEPITSDDGKTGAVIVPIEVQDVVTDISAPKIEDNQLSVELNIDLAAQKSARAAVTTNYVTVDYTLVLDKGLDTEETIRGQEKLEVVDGKATLTIDLTGKTYTTAHLTIKSAVTSSETVDPETQVNVTIPAGTGYTVTGEATAEKNGSYTFTVENTEGYTIKSVTVTNKDGELKYTVDGTTYTIADVGEEDFAITVVAESNDPSVKGDLPAVTEENGTITVPFYGTKATGTDLLAQINAGLKDKGIELTQALGTYGVDAEGNEYTIQYDEYFLVELGDNSLYVKSGESTVADTGLADGAYMSADKYIADAAVTVTDGTLNLGDAIAADISLVAAYKVEFATITDVRVEGAPIGGDANEVTSGNYVKADSKLVITGAQQAAGKYTQLTVKVGDGTAVGQDKAQYTAASSKASYTYTVNAADTAGITLGETAGYLVKLGDTELGISAGATTTATDSIVYSGSSIAANGQKFVVLQYVAEEGDTKGDVKAAHTNDANNYFVTAEYVVGGTAESADVDTKFTFGADVSTLAYEGIITLAPAQEVVVGAGLQATYTYGSLEYTTALSEDTYYIAKTAALTVKATDAAAAGVYERVAVTVGDSTTYSEVAAPEATAAVEDTVDADVEFALETGLYDVAMNSTAPTNSSGITLAATNFKVKKSDSAAAQVSGELTLTKPAEAITCEASDDAFDVEVVLTAADGYFFNEAEVTGVTWNVATNVATITLNEEVTPVVSADGMTLTFTLTVTPGTAGTT